LLAAGEGSRLGGLPKALIKIDGTSILTRQLQVLYEAGIAHVTVVTGHFHEQIEPALTALSFLGMSIGLVRNAAPERGQGSSVRLGMESILHQGQQSADTNAVVVMLSDQPLVDAQDLTGLLDNFYHRAYGEVLIPYSNGDRGNPVIFSRKVIKQIVAGDSHKAGRSFIDKHPEQVIKYETGNNHFVIDLDNIDAIKSVADRFKLSIELPTIHR